MTVHVARDFALSLLLTTQLYSRIVSDPAIPPWCGSSGAITVYEAGFRVGGDALREYNSGVTNQTAGRVEEAIQHYRKALELEPGFTAAQNNLGTVFIQSRRAGEALPVLQDGIRTDPACGSLYTNLAMALIVLGKPADGEAAAKRARGLNPMDGRARLLVAFSLFAQSKSASESVRAVREAPLEHALWVLRMAADLSLAGNVQLARNLLTGYIEMDGGPPEVRERALAGLRILSVD